MLLLLLLLLSLSLLLLLLDTGALQNPVRTQEYETELRLNSSLRLST